jgi:hypothetical protein
MGRGRAAGGAVGEGLNRAAPLFGLLLYVRRKETGRRKKRREERKKKRREGKKGKIFQTWKFLKNKRYFMKLVKNYFCKRKIYAYL